jgi:hypothetical protein
MELRGCQHEQIESALREVELLFADGGEKVTSK